MQPQTTSERSAFSVAEVMVRTGLGRDTVYGLIRDGQLVARKVGRRTLVVGSDLEKFLTSLPVSGRSAA